MQKYFKLLITRKTNSGSDIFISKIHLENFSKCCGSFGKVEINVVVRSSCSPAWLALKTRSKVHVFTSFRGDIKSIYILKHYKTKVYIYIMAYLNGPKLYVITNCLTETFALSL